MPRQNRALARCICGHHRTMHAYTATGLGRCSGAGLCLCEKFVPPSVVRAQRRKLEFEKALARANAELSEAERRRG